MQRAFWGEEEHCALREGLVLRQEGAERWEGESQRGGQDTNCLSCRAWNSGSKLNSSCSGWGPGRGVSRGAVWSVWSALNRVKTGKDPEGRGWGLGPTGAGPWAELSRKPGDSAGAALSYPVPPQHAPPPRLQGLTLHPPRVWLLRPSYKCLGSEDNLGNP